jgi:hypothetical protein
VRVRLSVLGHEVFDFVFALGAQPPEEETAESCPSLTSGHFERDPLPIFPEDRYGDDDRWIERPFGFGQPVT